MGLCVSYQGGALQRSLNKVQKQACFQCIHAELVLFVNTFCSSVLPRGQASLQSTSTTDLEGSAVNVIDLDVQGMICGACVARVMAALSTIVGVEDVQVDLHAGTVRVTSAATVAPSQLIAALAARRYETSVITHARPVIIKALTAL